MAVSYPIPEGLRETWDKAGDWLDKLFQRGLDPGESGRPPDLGGDRPAGVGSLLSGLLMGTPEEAYSSGAMGAGMMPMVVRGPSGNIIKAGRPGSKMTGEPGYVYHATNEENAFDISKGRLRTHKPWEGTDQNAWPDGAVEKRSYWSEKPDIVWQFAPEHGNPVALRTQKTPKFRQEITGDMYTKESINAKLLEILGEDNSWYPLVKFMSEL